MAALPPRGDVSKTSKASPNTGGSKEIGAPPTAGVPIPSRVTVDTVNAVTAQAQAQQQQSTVGQGLLDSPTLTGAGSPRSGMGSPRGAGGVPLPPQRQGTGGALQVGPPAQAQAPGGVDDAGFDRFALSPRGGPEQRAPTQQEFDKGDRRVRGANVLQRNDSAVQREAMDRMI